MSTFLRIKEWWNSKIVVLFGLIYLFLIYTEASPFHLVEKLLFLALWMVLAASFGYYINDVFDLPQDLLANKTNQTKSQHFIVKLAIIVINIGGIALIWYYLNGDELIAYLIVAQVILFVLYSFYGIRLKEKPVIGVITDALYAHLIPGLIVLYTIVPKEQIALSILITFCLWMCFVGVRNILSHHLVDYDNDILSATTTSATYFGKFKVKRLMNLIISPLEIFSFIALLVFMQKPLIWFVPIFILYIIYVYKRELIFVKKHINDWNQNEKENYNFLGGVVLNEFYEKWLPVMFLGILCSMNTRYLPLLLLHLILFFHNLKDFSKDYLVVKNIFLVRAYWFLAHVFYYSTYLKIKHFLYWKVKHSKHFLYWRVKDKTHWKAQEASIEAKIKASQASWEAKKSYRHFKIVMYWKIKEFIRKIKDFFYWNYVKYVKFKLWGNIKHFVYWKLYIPFKSNNESE